MSRAGLLGCQPPVSEAHPRVHIEYPTRVDDNYVFAEGTMSGTVRGSGSYTVPVQIYYPTEGGNGTAVLELTNSAFLFCQLAACGDRVGDRRLSIDDIDEIATTQVNFGLAGAKEYLLRNGFTHMAIQWNKMVTDFMGEELPERDDRRRLLYGHIEKAADGYPITRDAARWLAAAQLAADLVRTDGGRRVTHGPSAAPPSSAGGFYGISRDLLENQWARSNCMLFRD